MARSVNRSWRRRKGAEKAAFSKASRARSALRAAQAATLARVGKHVAPARGRRGRGRPVRQPAAPAGGGDLSDSEDSRILEPAGEDSDGDLEPAAGHDSDVEQQDDGEQGAGGGDAPAGQPGGGGPAGQPGGGALPPPLLATLGGRTLRVRCLLGGVPVPAPPDLRPLHLHPACPHCHTIPMDIGKCCSNVGERKPCPKCQSLLWPGEKGKCCRDGKEVLGPDLNPPIDASYLALVKELHFSHNSRIINSSLWDPRAPFPPGTWVAWGSTTSPPPFCTSLASPTS